MLNILLDDIGIMSASSRKISKFVSVKKKETRKLSPQNSGLYAALEGYLKRLV